MLAAQRNWTELALPDCLVTGLAPAFLGSPYQEALIYA
jgi:hypothetical protein